MIKVNLVYVRPMKRIRRRFTKSFDSVEDVVRFLESDPHYWIADQKSADNLIALNKNFIGKVRAHAYAVNYKKK